MKFIRHQELKRLNRLYNSQEAGIAVIWGRRRIGKTRLLLEWVNKHKGIYYAADKSSASVQKKYFALAIAQVFPGFAEVEYSDWYSLFSRLAKEASHINWRGPLVIDELPYLVSTSPEFPSMMQKFIDHEAKKVNLVIALCGSSQTLMQGAILDASAPLFGRASENMKLGPIAVGYLSEFLREKSPREIIENYCIWGGIPRYWELARNYNANGESLLETVDQLVLDPLGPLSDEPNRLLL